MEAAVMTTEGMKTGPATRADAYKVLDDVADAGGNELRFRVLHLLETLDWAKRLPGNGDSLTRLPRWFTSVSAPLRRGRFASARLRSARRGLTARRPRVGIRQARCTCP
jgi:hypothetical protein